MAAAERAAGAEVAAADGRGHLVAVEQQPRRARREQRAVVRAARQAEPVLTLDRYQSGIELLTTL